MTLLMANASLAADRPNIILMLSDDQSWYGLSVQMPEKAAELEARLDEYLASVNADIPVVNPDYDPSKPSGWFGHRANPEDVFTPHDATLDVKRLYFPE